MKNLVWTKIETWKAHKQEIYSFINDSLSIRVFDFIHLFLFIYYTYLFTENINEVF